MAVLVALDLERKAVCGVFDGATKADAVERMVERMIEDDVNFIVEMIDWLINGLEN